MNAEQICTLLGTVERVVRIIQRGQVYEFLYTADTTGKDAAGSLQTSLVSLYKAAIELLAGSDTLFSKGTARQILHAIVCPKQAEGIVADLFKAEQTLAFDVQACEGMRGDRAGNRMDSRVDDLKMILCQLDPLLTRMDTGVANLLQKLKAADHDRLLDFISPVAFRDVLDTVKRKRTPGTGDWLLADESFQEWERIPSSSTLLFLEGNCMFNHAFHILLTLLCD